MKQQLEPLRLAGLSNMEAGQLVRRHLSDLKTIDPALLTDAPFNSYIDVLTAKTVVFEKGLAQIRKSEETQKIEQADEIRDKGVAAIGKSLNLFAVSDNPDEVEASRVLSIVFNNFKDLAMLGYEAETIAIDKLVSELEKNNYSDEINLLQMGRYISRLKTANENFKTLFGGRMVITANVENYDLKAIRTEMLAQYSEFANYVLAMAKAVNSPLFVSALDLLNTARKYYADQLARHSATKSEEEKTEQPAQ